jgi:hypothetical protein
LKLAMITAVFLAAAAGQAPAQETAPDGRDRKIQELEQSVRRLTERVDALGKAGPSYGGSWTDRFTVGGYGEMQIGRAHV